MRRVKASFRWEVNMWNHRAEVSRHNGSDGQTAYALRQANIRQDMLQHCEHVWVRAYELFAGPDSRASGNAEGASGV